MKATQLILIILLITKTIPSRADVLVSPSKVPFAKDVIINKFNGYDALKFFTIKGGSWQIKKSGLDFRIIGTSVKEPAVLMSLDKLSRAPKNLKIDFDIVDPGKKIGFVYGKFGAIISSGRIYPATFSLNGKMLTPLGDKGAPVTIHKKTNTFEINTGFDPLGSGKLGTILYVNGTGVEVPYQNEDAMFGFIIYRKNTFGAYNFRWGIGST